MSEHHPATATWELPPDDRPALPAPLERTNLRALAARPDRFEHHLMVVGRVGDLQIESPTASEPLYFAHVNVSDEYVLGLPSGDPLMDAFPMRVFIGDPATGADVARVNHGVGDLVLHPFGYQHWTARLRPPYEPPPFAPGMRRSGVTVVLCAAEERAPSTERPLFVSAGHEAAAKRYGDEDVPLLMAHLADEGPRTLGVVGNARFELMVTPQRIAPERGGYVLVLATADEPHGHFPTDLVYVPEGAALDGRGIERAIVCHSAEAAPEPPPASWTAVPEAPFAPYEDGEAYPLPFRLGAFEVDAIDDGTVRVTVGPAVSAVPRYWMARMLFRLALHGFRLGRLETYGGFMYDDTPGRVPEGEIQLGLGPGAVGPEGAGLPIERAMVSVPRHEAREVVETLYRAVAPPGYTERLV